MEHLKNRITKSISKRKNKALIPQREKTNVQPFFHLKICTGAFDHLTHLFAPVKELPISKKIKAALITI